jgi:hypothetical protein
MLCFQRLAEKTERATMQQINSSAISFDFPGITASLIQ